MNFNKKASKSMSSTSTTALNSIVQNTVLEGSIRCESDIRIDGTLTGNLYCNAKVIIGTTGVVEGEVRCKNATIDGKLTGTIIVEGLLQLRETAVCKADVTTTKTEIQNGAIFDGKIQMTEAIAGENNLTIAS